MKVVHLASGDTWGGAERVLMLLLEGLRVRRGVEVEVLLFNEGRLADAIRSLGTCVRVIPETEHSLPGLVLATRRWLVNARADVVHAHRYKEILTASLALLPRRRGLVVTVHGLEPRTQLTPMQFVRVWTSLLVARLAGARFVAVSRELAQRLQRRLGADSVVNIPNPLPPSRRSQDVPDIRRRLGWDASRSLIGFVGRLERVKGPDRFIDLAALHRGDAGFILVGAGSCERSLRDRVAAEGLSGRVAFVGEVQEATGYLKQLDLLALPSRHEGFPMVLLEAAASEIPVVAFDVGGVREVLEGGPAMWLVEPGRIDMFSDTVREVLRDREGNKRAANRWASSVRARFSLAKVLSAYTGVYMAATSKSGQARSGLL